MSMERDQQTAAPMNTHPGAAATTDYHPPTLTSLGSVAELTLTGFQTGSDGVNAGGGGANHS
jgi:hypothetical protein